MRRIEHERAEHHYVQTKGCGRHQNMRGAYTRALLVMVLLTVGPARAEPDSFYRGDGTDGVLNLNGNTTVRVNSYAQVTEPLAPGDFEFSISPKSDVKPGRGRTDDDAFQADDLVLILQTTGIVPQIHTRMSEPLDIGTSDVGRWEFARLASANMNGSKLVLKAPLTHAYAAGVTQVIRVPEYSSVSLGNNVTLQAEPWSESLGFGGVIAFLVTGDVTVGSNSEIVANGSGFRGGQYSADLVGTTACPLTEDSGDSPSRAQKGEGVDNTRYTRTSGEQGTGRGNSANGGGGGICVRAGGGGGGNAGFGGKGGRTGESPAREGGGYGGVPLLYSMLERLIFGGGGGSGHARLAGFEHASGGRGGGIVFIRADNVTLADDAAISAAGAVGLDGSLDAGGGGGAGGTVLLRLTGTLTCTSLSTLGANGGDGGAGTTTVTPNTGGGGGGGGGRMLYQANTVSCPAIAVNGGRSGGVGAAAGLEGVISKLPGAFPSSPLPVPSVLNPSGSTKERRPPITGNAQANRQVIIYLNGVEVGRTYASGTGSFSFTVPEDLSDGEYTATAAITYQGVASPRSTGRDFSVDATKPLRPLIDTLGTPAKAASEGMLIGQPALTLNTTSGKYELSISGKAEPGALVTVKQLNDPGGSDYDNGSFNDTSKTGSWTVKIAQLDGQPPTAYKLEVTARDAAGNLSEPTTLTFHLDTQKPAAPSVAKVGDKTPMTGACSATPPPFVTTQLPLIEGTAEAGSTVTATLTPDSAPSTPYAVAQTLVKGTAGSTASWSTAPVAALPKPNDKYTLTVMVTDAAGNPSPNSTYCFELDATAPTRPVVATLGNNSARWTAREGMRIGNNDLTLNTTSGKYELAIRGTVESGSKGLVRQLRQDGTEFASVSFDDSSAKTGNWAVNIAQQEGVEFPYKLEVTATDAAGNPSEPATLTFNLDTKAPAAPSVAKVGGTSPTVGACGTASVQWVKTRLPLIEGSAEAGSTVTASLTPKSRPSTKYPVAQTQANGTPGYTGTWSSGPASALPEPNDEYTLTVTVTDEAGNPSPESTYCFALDATPPAPLVLTAITLGKKTASNGLRLGLAGLTEDSKLRISGTAELGSSVGLKLIPLDPMKGVEESTPSAPMGSWHYDWSDKVSGVYAVEARVKDPAGNESDPVSFFFNLDLIRPTVALTGRPDAGTTTTSKDAVFGFTPDEAVTSYRCNINGEPRTPCKSPLFFTTPADVEADDYTLEVWATDLAGNETLEEDPATWTWRVDSNQPTVIILGVGVVGGIPASGGTTKSTGIEFKLQANKPGLRIDCSMDPRDADEPDNWEEPCRCDETLSDPAGPICVKHYSGLADKFHMLIVKAKSTETGAETPSYAWKRYQWEVDITAPDTFVTSQPEAWVDTRNVRVEYTTPTESRKSTFKCNLNGEEFLSCPSPFVRSVPADGAYTLLILATDEAKNEEAEAARVSWNVDTKDPVAPDVQLPVNGRRYRELALRGTAAGERLSRLSVYLDDDSRTPIGTAVISDNDEGIWQLVIAPAQKPTDGPHFVRLKVTDRANNESALSAPIHFVMDNEPPVVKIDGPEKNSLSRSAKFQFTANEGVTFQCKLDINAPTDCGAEVTFSDLEEGPHTLNLYAVDEAGNRTELGYSWSVYLGRDIRAEGGGLGCSASAEPPMMLWLLGLLGLLTKVASRHRATAGGRR